MNILAARSGVTARSGTLDEVDNVGGETLDLAAHVPAPGCTIAFPMSSKSHAWRAVLDTARDSAIRGDLAVGVCGGWRRGAAHDGDRGVGARGIAVEREDAVREGRRAASSQSGRTSPRRRTARRVRGWCSPGRRSLACGRRLFDGVTALPPPWIGRCPHRLRVSGSSTAVQIAIVILAMVVFAGLDQFIG